MTSTVCMPWRPQPDRMKAYDRVTDWWKRHGYNVIEADSDPDNPFSITEARNAAVRQADTDIVILADADTLPDLGAIVEAVNDPVGVTYPFTYYRHVAGEHVDTTDLFSAPFTREYKSSVGGLLVTTQDTYWSLGGMDERFEPRWGYEDNAFHTVAATLSSVRRMKGVIFSFDHHADRDLSDTNPNRARNELYRMCNGKPHLMRELLKR